MVAKRCIGLAIAISLAGCGGAPFTEATGDPPAKTAAKSEARADAPSSDDAGYTVDDAAANDAAVDAEAAASDGASDGGSQADAREADAGSNGDARAVDAQTMPDGATADAPTDAPAEACHPVCRFLDQGAYYINSVYTCAASCDPGGGCTVTNPGYGTMFPGTLVCQ